MENKPPDKQQPVPRGGCMQHRLVGIQWNTEGPWVLPQSKQSGVLSREAAYSWIGAVAGWCWQGAGSCYSGAPCAPSRLSAPPRPAPPAHSPSPCYHLGLPPRHRRPCAAWSCRTAGWPAQPGRCSRAGTPCAAPATCSAVQRGQQAAGCGVGAGIACNKSKVRREGATRWGIG